MSKKYKIGQILTVKNDIVVHSLISDDEIIIKKGSQGIIGADKLLHHFNGGVQRVFFDDDEIKGYDTDGIAEIIFRRIKREYPYYDDDTDFSEEDFKNIIKWALVEDLGF